MIYVYKQHFELNTPHGCICHKTQSDQTKPLSCCISLPTFFRAFSDLKCRRVWSNLQYFILFPFFLKFFFHLLSKKNSFSSLPYHRVTSNSFCLDIVSIFSFSVSITGVWDLRGVLIILALVSRSRLLIIFIIFSWAACKPLNRRTC